MADKVALFAKRGWIFASVNYRLTKLTDPVPARYPAHYDDVAAAVAWLRTHVKRRGGDPRRIALLGHSAGADIVSNVAVNPGYLRRHRQRLTALRCFAPLDTAGFDKPRASPREQVQWRLALGNQPDYMTSTSATLIARRGTGIAPALTVYRGTPGRQRIETAFAARLRTLGVPATLVDARSLNHAQVNASHRGAGRHRDDAAAGGLPAGLLQALGQPGAAGPGARAPGCRQILLRSSSFLPITMRWISEVPSPMSSSGASR